MLDENSIPMLDAISETIKDLEKSYQSKLTELQEQFKSALEQIKSGQDGKDGKDGKDRFVISAMSVADGEKVDKNVVVNHRGGLFTTDRKSNGTPSEDPGAYSCLVNGISEINIESIDDRKSAIYIELSNGLIVSHEIKFAVPLFKGPFSKDAIYEPGDIVIKDKKTLINIGGDEWKMFVFPEKGDKGDAGPQGIPGKDYADTLADMILEGQQ